MAFMQFLLWGVAVLLVLWWGVVLVERSAQRGERIYLARYRNHAAVPQMYWIDDL